MKLGFGTWQLGGECTFGGRQTGWGKINIEEAKNAIQFALDSGINFFDTAPSYGKGTSESLLGEVFKLNKSKNIEVCTKCGPYENDKGESGLDFSKKALLKSVEESLKRLKIDQIHTILLHSPADDFDFQNFDKSGFEQLIKEGKILNYGVSVKSLKGAINVAQNGFGNTIECIYNVLDRRVEDYTFNQYANFNIIGRVPLASGFLSDKFLANPDRIFPSNDIRSNINAADRLWYKNCIESLSFLKDLPGGISISALRYILFQEKTTHIIPGMRTVEQVENNLKAQELGPLPQEIIDKITLGIPTTNPAWLF